MVGDQQAVAVPDPFIRALVDEVDAIMLDYHTLCDTMTEEQLNWRPDPRRWSIAQCLHHITMTLRLYPQEIERMIGEARARAAAGAGAFREGMIARWIITSQEPPPRMRIRTRRTVEPPTRLGRQEVLGAFEAEHARLRELILACNGVPLNHARMRSPFVGLIHFTLQQALQVNLAHARRHLWQARQVRQEPAFPG